jgi:hypothetical protein
MHPLLVFNNRRQHPPIMLYNNLYPLKILAAAPSLYLTPNTNLLHTNTHKSSSDISHSLATSSAFSRPSALSNRRADCSMSDGAKVSGARVPVLLREVAEAMVDILAAVVAATDMNANMNARPLEASRRQARGVDLGAKEEVEMVASTSSVPIWDLVPVPKRLVFISYFFWELI